MGQTTTQGDSHAISVPVPASQAGDLILINFTQGFNFDVVNWPSGFSLIKSYKRANPYFSNFLFAKLAGSSEPTTFVFNLGADATITYRSIIVRGVNSNQPILSITERLGSGATISVEGINLQQGSLVMAFIGRYSNSGGTNYPDNWTFISSGYNGMAFYQIFGGASQTENPIILYYSGDNNDYWQVWLVELGDANPIIYNTIFINWLLTDEPGSKLWVKINGEWKPAKVTII